MCLCLWERKIAIETERDKINRREEDSEREDRNLDWRKERKNHILRDSPEYARAWLNVCSIEKEMDGSLCAFVCICMRVYACMCVCTYVCITVCIMFEQFAVVVGYLQHSFQ